MDDKVNEYFNYALTLVKDAGRTLLSASGYEVEMKSEIYDLVTVYDRKIEEVLISKLKEKWVDHKFISEEDSEENGVPALTDAPTWIIDPIDGTANFTRQLRMSAISVALVIQKQQRLGIVYNPFLDECYTAIKGQGAFLNGKPIQTNGVTDIYKSIFAYELSLARNPQYFDLYMYRLKHLLQVVMGIRSYGTATISLCYVADGRLDAYQCDGLYPWDVAAAGLIVEEAGGHICDTRGKQFDIMEPNFLATSTKKLAEEYLAYERKADEERKRDNDKCLSSV